jgi:predicted dinucleotide-binding enzyme
MMRFGVLGTGQVGSAICRKLAELGHGVMVGSRTPNSEKAQALAASTGTSMGTYAEAAGYGEWVVNALPGERAIGILRDCDIDGKTLIDIANYDSAVDSAIEVPLGEAIQRAFPRVRLVKTLNSVSAHLMVDPTGLGGLHHVFIASNDDDAKRAVEALLRSFGWQAVIDLGDLTACRAMEQLIPLWMQLERIFASPHFNLGVVRGQAQDAQG